MLLLHIFTVIENMFNSLQRRLTLFDLSPVNLRDDFESTFLVREYVNWHCCVIESYSSEIRPFKFPTRRRIYALIS